MEDSEGADLLYFRQMCLDPDAPCPSWVPTRQTLREASKSQLCELIIALVNKMQTIASPAP